MDCAIFDLDGTLADCRHRLPLLDSSPPQWDEFFARCGRDKPIPYALALNRMVGNQMPVAIVTGRPERTRWDTEEWLRRYVVAYQVMLMRPDGDRRPDTVVKREALERLRTVHFLDPLFAVEDRPSVVRMWRAAGVPCLAADDSSWKKPGPRYEGTED